ncbi:hypothetical protein JN531_012125 [Flagellatimonas centrodinii]|uniref:hypothetical protein n=1 Tax=Flagellatimonas centrodinii TaxID=2806210 RepID=UPI001FEF27A3|nr:hypothetical protein [Flagellatimonas centrodinii]ULQ45847.1 hypothetical protein JN531_012125 [Flagellatimonas centrodinii]
MSPHPPDSAVIKGNQLGLTVKRITAYARMCARSDLESFCRWNDLDGHAWCDTSAIHPEGRECCIGLDLSKKTDLTAHPKHPHLVRIDIEKADRT